MTHPKVALVVPSIREGSFGRFVDEWSKVRAADGSNLFDRCDLILMEDNPRQTFKVPITAAHLSWADIDNHLKENAWVIPRRSDTVRSFAYWLAWRNGYDYIMTLDDDCYPNAAYPTPDLDHLAALSERTRWYNTLTSVKPRGVPFYNVGVSKRTVLNHGLWTNVIDYDAPTQLAAPVEELFSHDNRTVPSGMYYPMCGMNVMWRADVTYAMYHLLMGRMSPDVPRVMRDWTSLFPLDNDGLLRLPFDRFGDIWAGLLSKRFFDSYEMNVATGTPYIHHDRASDPFVNLRKEANGLQVNEHLWEMVDVAEKHSPIEWDGPLEAYQAICDGTFAQAALRYPEHEAYFRLLQHACTDWTRLFVENDECQLFDRSDKRDL